MPRRGWPHGAAASRTRGRPSAGRPVSDQRGRLPVATLGFAGLPMLSYDRALWELRFWLDSLGRHQRDRHRHGASGLRSPARPLRRAGLAGHLLPDRDGALDHERHGLSVGTHAVAIEQEGPRCYPPLADHWSTRGDASWRRAPMASGRSSPFTSGMLQWRNCKPRRARTALGGSRRRTPSSSATGCWAISIVGALVF